MIINASDPAFPVPCDCKTTESGMTIRTYLAGLAMQGILANSARDYGKEDLINEAVHHADSMIKRLNEKAAS